MNVMTEYIVTATNAYPALTARVKELEEALELMIGLATNRGWSEHDPLGLKMARAALNKEPTT